MGVRKTLRVAIIRMTLASLSFAVMGVLVKASSRESPFLVAVFFRTFIGLVMLTLWFLFRGIPFKAVQHGLLLLRSLFGFIALTLFFLALERLPLSNAVILNFSSPVFVVLLSGVLLGEQKVTTILPFVLLAFIGAGLLVAPDLSSINIVALLALLSAFFAALAYLSVKKLSRTESPETIVFYFSLYGSIFAAVSVVLAPILGGEPFATSKVLSDIGDPVSLAMLCGIGVFATIGQLFLTSAYAVERASVVTGFSYLNPLLSYLLGLLFFGEKPTPSSLLGGALVIGGCAGVLWAAREPLHPTPPPPE